MIKIITPSRREIDVRRPNGSIETVDVSDRYHHIDQRLIDHLMQATRNAGKGDIIAYRNIDAIVEDDHICHCDRCKTQLDDRTTKSKIIRSSYGPVKVHYCRPCSQLLGVMGALDEIIDNTPTAKQDF